MSRPAKSTVDYFPHVCKDGKTMFVIESKFGNDGYAFWFKILELLGSTEGHCYNCNGLAEIEYLTAKTHLEWDKCCQILDVLANLGAIDLFLWQEKLIWSDNFVVGIADAYRRRKDKLPQKPTPVRINDGRNSQATELMTVETGKEKEKEKEKEKKYTNDSDSILLAEFFIGLLDARGYEWKGGKKPDNQKWAVEFDKLIRIDKRPAERIKEVLRWCQSPGCFWQSNILSPSKLREKWGQLTEQMKNTKVQDDSSESTVDWFIRTSPDAK